METLAPRAESCSMCMNASNSFSSGTMVFNVSSCFCSASISVFNCPLCRSKTCNPVTSWFSDCTWLLAFWRSRRTVFSGDPGVYSPARNSTSARTRYATPWMGAGSSRNEIAMTLSPSAPAAAACNRLCRWQREVCGKRKQKDGYAGLLVVLLGFLDFDLAEITGSLELGNQVGHRGDGISRTFHGQFVALAGQRGHPQRIHAVDGIGHLLQKLL